VRDPVVQDKNHEMWLLCNQVHDAMSKIRGEELNRIGVSRIQSEVLFIVKVMEGPVTPAKLSRWLLRKPHTVSELLVRMEKEGLIKRAKDLKRKNQIRVSLTKKGERIYLQSRDLKAIRGILSDLSKEEKDNLRTYLIKLRGKSLKQLGIERELPFP
jgi:DNA-binding MarR family transcriptional regulator